MVRVIETCKVATVTGPGSTSRTDERFAINGTDLGILWDGGDGRVLALFGDTYGAGWGGSGAGPDHADWRCNVLAFSTTRDLSAGMELDGVVARPDGGAAQIIARDPRRDEHTVIPNGAIAVNGTQYAHYMSIRHWGRPGRWVTNYAGIAVSTDGGSTWTKPERARWINRAERDHPFQIGAFASDDDYVYLFGTPNGRFGDAHLARVRPGDVLEPSAYRYLAGSAWIAGELAATPVFGGPVGELSIAYNVYFGQWMAVYLDVRRAAIVLRTAEAVDGPWSEPEVLVSGRDHPALYGGYLHPWALDGPEIYYLMSQWQPYNVFLMRSTLVSYS
ncbi:MAG: DUF4185 domain-containing protein [Haloechinothrix sp.]